MNVLIAAWQDAPTAGDELKTLWDSPWGDEVGCRFTYYRGFVSSLGGCGLALDDDDDFQKMCNFRGLCRRTIVLLMTSPLNLLRQRESMMLFDLLIDLDLRACVRLTIFVAAPGLSVGGCADRTKNRTKRLIQHLDD